MTSESSYNFHVSYEKRFYYLIAFAVDPDTNSEELLKIFGIKRTGKNYEQFVHEDFTVYKNTITSEVRYYYGANDEGKEKAPYDYDVFGIVVNNIKTIIVGYPFRALAAAKINEAVEIHRLLRKGRFYKPALEKFVKLNETHLFKNELFSTVISGLEIGLSAKEAKVGSMSLGGTDPMSTEIYAKTFSPLIGAANHTLKRCTFRCDLYINQLDLPTTTAQILADRFGNLRLYVHNTGRGFYSLPFLFQLLKHEDCLLTTVNNPILRVDKSEDF